MTRFFWTVLLIGVANVAWADTQSNAITPVGSWGEFGIILITCMMTAALLAVLTQKKEEEVIEEAPKPTTLEDLTKDRFTDLIHVHPGRQVGTVKLETKNDNVEEYLTLTRLDKTEELEKAALKQQAEDRVKWILFAGISFAAFVSMLVIRFVL
ncbi:MAG: hypothetical protein AAF740_04975 [Bacteroidota bacterium]